MHKNGHTNILTVIMFLTEYNDLYFSRHVTAFKVQQWTVDISN